MLTEKASWTYFILLGLSLAYPLAQSFEKRIFMFRKMIFIFPGILVTGAIFILWDLQFAENGTWGFNPNFTRDFYLGSLPVEEWLFFFVIPYCCFFLYEVLRYYLKKAYFPVVSKVVMFSLTGLFLVSLPFLYDRIYTFVAVLFASFVLVLQILQRTYRTWFSGFILTYMISLIPFFLINGVLTSLPVVWYNNMENTGIRAGTIPLEDFIYLFGLLIPSFNLYHLLLQRFAGRKLRADMRLDEVTGF